MGAFPSTAWNINVINSGSSQTGKNLQGQTIEKVGTMPPQTGMPVYFDYFPVTPKRYIQSVDPLYGFVTVAVSGASGDAAIYGRYYSHEVNVWVSDAVKYGYPSGANTVVYTNSPFIPPSRPVRGTDFLYGPGGSGFTYR